MYDLEIIIKLISPGSIPTTGSGFGSGCWSTSTELT
jgi:hypothetical protein